MLDRGLTYRPYEEFLQIKKKTDSLRMDSRGLKKVNTHVTNKRLKRCSASLFTRVIHMKCHSLTSMTEL